MYYRFDMKAYHRSRTCNTYTKSEPIIWNRKAPTHFVPAADIKSFLSFAAPASSMPLEKSGFAILQTLSY